MPEDANWDAVFDAISMAKMTEEALLRYDERGSIPDEELTEDEWDRFVAYNLRSELADPREDIYGLEDGTPSHERNSPAANKRN